MESDVGQTGLLEQYLQSAVSRVRICRQLRAGGMGEYPLTDGSLLSLPQELYDALGQDDGACALAGLGVAQGEYAHLFTMEGTLRQRLRVTSPLSIFSGDGYSVVEVLRPER